MRRRGIPPECINKFVTQLGLTVALTAIDPSMLNSVVRDYLNVKAPRYYFIFWVVVRIGSYKGSYVHLSTKIFLIRF